MKGHFTVIREIEESNIPKNSGFFYQEECDRICEITEVEKRDKQDLQDLLDFSHCYFNFKETEAALEIGILERNKSDNKNKIVELLNKKQKLIAKRSIITQTLKERITEK